ncbi:unnamed protein product [Lathyrus sativus]|nr:unnamed protein product [Lathyrus sativus]
MGRRGRPPKVVSTPSSAISNNDDDIPSETNVNASKTQQHGGEEPTKEIVEEQESSKSRTLISPKGATEPRRLWVDVISGNRNPGNGLTLEFIAPTIVNGIAEVRIEEADTVTEVKFWETTLIMYVVGGDLSMNTVKQFMLKQWNFVKLPDMYYNNEGYFVLRFHSHKERDDVLMKGPYTIRNMPMLLAEWKPNFNLKNDMLRTIPVWIQLPQLPLHLWGAKNLGKMASMLGTPLMTDECTTNKYRISYARVLVEVDVT